MHSRGNGVNVTLNTEFDDAWTVKSDNQPPRDCNIFVFRLKNEKKVRTYESRSRSEVDMFLFCKREVFYD